jgi:hypothetical protein
MSSLTDARTNSPAETPLARLREQACPGAGTSLSPPCGGLIQIPWDRFPRADARGYLSVAPCGGSGGNRERQFRILDCGLEKGKPQRTQGTLRMLRIEPQSHKVTKGNPQFPIADFARVCRRDAWGTIGLRILCVSALIASLGAPLWLLFSAKKVYCFQPRLGGAADSMKKARSDKSGEAVTEIRHRICE